MKGDTWFQPEQPWCVQGKRGRVVPCSAQRPEPSPPKFWAKCDTPVTGCTAGEVANIREVVAYWDEYRNQWNYEGGQWWCPGKPYFPGDLGCMSVDPGFVPPECYDETSCREADIGKQYRTAYYGPDMRGPWPPGGNEPVGRHYTPDQIDAATGRPKDGSECVALVAVPEFQDKTRFLELNYYVCVPPGPYYNADGNAYYW
jgi:hypothetical protein